MTDIACWVLKANPETYDLRTNWEQGLKVQGWTLHKTYRVELMAPGQRCLLWLSGPEEPGIYALGKLTDFAFNDGRGGGPHWRDVARAQRLVPWVPIEVVPLSAPVLRADLMQEAGFREAEFVRMAAGSNPSYLDPDRFKVVEGHLQAADMTAAGW
jgi:hypothetical protein